MMKTKENNNCDVDDDDDDDDDEDDDDDDAEDEDENNNPLFYVFCFVVENRNPQHLSLDFDSFCVCWIFGLLLWLVLLN